MIGRAAMSHRIFGKQMLAQSLEKSSSSFAARPLQEHILRHVQLTLDWGRYGGERHTLQALRSRLMAYSKRTGRSKLLRGRFSSISSRAELEDLAAGIFGSARGF
ncbi:MAG: hypothetical protein R3F31_28415 [Verrucomicrobiales bacterium]